MEKPEATNYVASTVNNFYTSIFEATEIDNSPISRGYCQGREHKAKKKKGWKQRTDKHQHREDDLLDGRQTLSRSSTRSL